MKQIHFFLIVMVILGLTITVNLYNNAPKSKGECVIVQKSSVGEDMISELDDPEFWLMTSIMSKENDDSYLGIVEDMVSNSFSFEGYPAASAGFVVEVEEGDTIVMKQTIVIVDGKELYYLNNQFIGGDDSEESLGDSILRTIRFKNGIDKL